MNNILKLSALSLAFAGMSAFAADPTPPATTPPADVPAAAAPAAPTADAAPTTKEGCKALPTKADQRKCLKGLKKAKKTKDVPASR